MVLAAPDPLLAPPPSSSPPKTPHRSYYSSQIRSQNEEKNPPPKLYLPLQTRTRHRQSHRPHTYGVNPEGVEVLLVFEDS